MNLRWLLMTKHCFENWNRAHLPTLRDIDIILEFNPTVCFLPGKLNCVADNLSRVTVKSLFGGGQPAIPLTRIAIAQKNDN